MNSNTVIQQGNSVVVAPLGNPPNTSPESPEWETIVKREYPQAREGNEVTLTYLQLVENELGIARDRTLLGTCICSDDINTTSNGFSKNFRGPFTIGGLGGLPFGGITALMAYGHHIPEHGVAFIFFGPHIGITKEGELGRVLRPGQTRYSSSCGALMLALNRLTTRVDLSRGASATFDDDHQQRVIEQSLMPFREQIISAPNPRKEVTDMAYAIIHHRLRDLVLAAKAEIHARYIVLLGGITINTEPEVPDYVDLRHYEVIENHS